MLVLVIVIAIIVLLALISEFFLHFALSTHVKPGPYEEGEDEKNERLKSEEFFKTECRDVYITAFDGIKLHAHLYDKNKETNKWLICVHGYKGKAEENGVFFRYMANNGYNTLVLDVRGHRESKADWLSMGLWESDDLIRWTKYIRENYEGAKIALQGDSMGAATVMMAASKNPEGVYAVIEDCGYSSLFKEYETQIKEQFHLPPHPILDIVNLWCKIRLGFFFGEINPEKALKTSRLPILFIHGDQDTFVPFKMVFELYESYEGEKELWVTEGVKHAFSMLSYKEEYTKRGYEFIEKHIS